MKKSFLYLVSLCLLAFCAISCDNDDPITPEVTVNTTTVSIAFEGGTGDFTVTANCDWSLTKPADAGWITSITPMSGSAGDTKVTIDAAENTTGGDRSATLLVKANGIEKSVTVKQTKYPLPAAPGAIQGTAEVRHPDVSTELSISAVQYATSYQWYFGGQAISGANGLTHTATESGEYAVAGVNASGEGPRSDAFTVTIYPAPLTIDDLVGEWQVEEDLAYGNADWAVTSYTATIAKVNNDTITISGLGRMLDGKGFEILTVKAAVNIEQDALEGELIIEFQLINAINPLYMPYTYISSSNFGDLLGISVVKQNGQIVITFTNYKNSDDKDECYIISAGNSPSTQPNPIVGRGSTVMTKTLE